MSANLSVASHLDDMPTVDALMARFPGPVSIHPDAGKLSGLMIIALSFVLGCGWLIVRPAWPGNNIKLVLLALCGAYFAWQFVGLARLLSGTPLLTLRNDGLFVTNGFRRWDFSWNDVGESVVLRYGVYAWWSFVGIRHRKRPGDPPAFSSLIRLPKVQPMKPAELVHLINRWRETALADAAKGGSSRA